jgi:tetratricopeptide (TPR) repeat protein
MTNSIENIYSDFRTNYVDNADFAINFYEKNSTYFNNIKQFNNKEELRLYIALICKYAEANYQKDRCNLAIEIVDKQQLFIDTEIRRLNANDLKDAWYRSLQFVKGMASYKLKDYKTATPIFKKLVQYDNQNDRYKNWLTHSQYGLKLWLVRTINIVCVGLVAVEMIFRSQIPNYFVRETILVVGLLGLLSNWAYEQYLKRNHRKANAN